MLSNSIQCIRRLLRNEDGPTAVEYAVLLALIVVVCIASIYTIGNNLDETYEKANSGVVSGT
jgi:pilus assembly protein Flp/PilA